MRKPIGLFAVVLAMAMLFTGCGSTAQTKPAPEAVEEATEEVAEEEMEEEAEEEEEVPEVAPEGMYKSELTGEWISEEIKDQRPIAAMVDNEITALPHFGVNQADVVYEMMNSTKNGRITRLMCLVKDWGKIEQLGSIRSVRPTNILLAAEWNAVICHDGGPFYIDAYFANDYAAHFSGTFSRVNNGKSREFTEYILPGDLDKNFNNYANKPGYSREYNEYYPGEHYQFTTANKPIDYSEDETALIANEVRLPFEHNGSYLKYNEAEQVYEYYEYGSAHVDAGDNNKITTFKNVLLQYCTFHQYDENGYMIYNCIDSGKLGYYITNGRAIHITWRKTSDTDVTRYFDEAGNEIKLNIGKTYVSLIPDDNWGDLSIK